VSRGSKLVGVVRQNAIGLLALFVALGGGTYAATRDSFVGRSGVINGCVPKKGGPLDVLKPGKKCPRGTVALPFNAQGSPGVAGARGSPGIAGQPGAGGAEGAPGATGVAGAAGTARAYGWVIRLTAGFLDAAHTKNVFAVTNPSIGVYCIQLAASIDASSAVLLATPDYEDSTPFAGAVVVDAYPRASAVNCTTPNTLAVVTGYEGVEQGPPVHPSFNPENESFYFAVP
jgi:hypothetical protein